MAGEEAGDSKSRMGVWEGGEKILTSGFVSGSRRGGGACVRMWEKTGNGKNGGRAEALLCVVKGE